MAPRLPTSKMRSVTRLTLDRELRRQFARLKPGVVLDVGSKRSPYREWIAHTSYLRLDIDPNSQPDLCCSVYDIRSEPEKFDVVIATEILEHLREPHRAIDEFLRVLKPGGVCILSTRFICQYHADPEDYFRFTHDSLRHLFRGFRVTEVHHHGNRFQSIWALLDHGNMRLFMRPWNRLVARIHSRRTKAPLGFVVWAEK